MKWAMLNKLLYNGTLREQSGLVKAVSENFRDNISWSTESVTVLWP